MRMYSIWKTAYTFQTLLLAPPSKKLEFLERVFPLAVVLFSVLEPYLYLSQIAEVPV